MRLWWAVPTDMMLRIICIFRYHIHFYDVTTVASRVRCERLDGGKKPAECLRILQPGGEWTTR